MRVFLLILFSIILISCSRSTQFELLDSKQTGIDFNNNISENDSSNILTHEYISNGAGVGIGDLNNDGQEDIIFAGNKVSSRVYLNLGNFKFKDITSNFEGLSNDQWYSGVSLVDINSDGWLDVYLTSTCERNPEGCSNRLWINMGIEDKKGPVFTEMAEDYGIAYSGPSVSSAFFDYDRDGDLDLYILNSSFTSRMSTTYRPKILDGSAVNNDRLFQNNGNNTFTDVTIQAGIICEGFGLGIAIGDLNKDGYPDIYVSNDYISNDLLYINKGNGTFRNEISKYMSYQTKSSMGNDMADVNNDGNPDVFTLDMMPESYWKKKQTINGFSYIYYMFDEKFGYEHQYLRNMLYLHNGFINGKMLPFSETGQIAGVYQTDWSWSALFADYDNDADKDLIITTGYPKDLRDQDWLKHRQKDPNSNLSDEDIISLMPSVKVPNVAFENVGKFSFVKRDDWLPAIPSYSYGASYADLDNDGDLDYVINNLDDKAFILKNNNIEKAKKKFNYIKIRLTGKDRNTMAIGAKVELWSNGRYQFYEHFLTRGYASSVDPVIHFGLSNDSLIDSIRVTWPAGNNISVLKNVSVNNTLIINETNSVHRLTQSGASENQRKMFSACDEMIDYMHDQTDVVDFFLSQKIIPHKFSQIGPSIAKGEIDNDGREDLIIGSSNKLPTAVYLRKGKGFKKSAFEGLTTQKEFTESDLAILDIDKDGDNDVIAVAGGYETRRESERQQDFYMAVATGYEILNDTSFRHYSYENREGVFIRKALPVPPFLASVIKPCDYNHDGYIDIFIGSRIKRGRFPDSNNSWLLINKNGQFTEQYSSPFKLGMVTDAIWTDYDNDGWEDLMITRDWNSIIVLKNIDGKELVQQIIPELENYHGIWYAVTAGDFDKDGDDDYIAGNLGNNHRFKVSDQYPLRLYAIDLELDGILDPIITSYWKDINNRMVEYPVNYLDELQEESSFFQMKFSDYTSFSFTGFKEMLDEKMLKRAEFKLHVNTTYSYIVWNDAGRFRLEKLHDLCQLSPLKRMIVRDFNDDNYPDVIIGGNDYTHDISTGYYDALKGIVLLSKGKNQSFDALTPSESGLLLQGMVESLVYIDGDTSLVVAGINRDKVSVSKHVKY